jgi:hypothetical protein
MADGTTVEAGGARVNQSYIRRERLWLKAHPELSERWVQELIARDPSILGLGAELELLRQELIQPRAGRLDLLLQHPETKRRYEVELQLGATDESHIIRTIEYWDIERKRYPQYDHCAVLVAEDITSRFLNVISLFNGTIPFVAIQMQALRIGEHITLVFTTVVDELTRGLVDEDEDGPFADRAWWEKKAPATIVAVDELLQIAKQFDPSIQLKYKKSFIGLSRAGEVVNLVTVYPRKTSLEVQIKLPETDDLNAKIEVSGVDTFPYNWGRYRLRLTKDDVESKAEIIRELMNLAYADARPRHEPHLGHAPLIAPDAPARR